MRFLYPSLFMTWAALVIVPLLLYLFRPRPKTVRTSTLPFFKWLAREHQDNAWLKRLKHLVSLLITLFIVIAGAAALARLVVAPAAGAVRTVVILVDRSASMAAESAGEKPILRGIQRSLQRLAALPAGVGVIVIAYDRRPEVLLARTYDHRQVQRALQGIRVRPVTGSSGNALQLAKQLAALETPAMIWHITDGTNESGGSKSMQLGRVSPDNVSNEAEKVVPTGEDVNVAVVPILVGFDDPVNVGITGFRIRRRPLERSQMEAFVQLHSSASQKAEVDLEMKLDGELVALRKLSFAPNSSQRLLVPIEAFKDRDRICQLKLRVEGDVLPQDNVVVARVPKLEPIRVLWITENPDPFTTLALSTLAVDSDIRVLQGNPESWPGENKVDLVIFDDWLPDEWPKNLPVVVLNPTKSLGPLQVARINGDGLPVEHVRAANSNHPLLYGVATGRVSVTQTAVLESSGGLQPLWVGSQGALLMAGEFAGQRVAVLACSPQKSEQLPLMASYPLLIGNAVYWTAEKSIQAARGLNRKTGELISLKVNEFVWQGADGEEDETKIQVQNQFVELDRIGLWKAADGQRGSAALLSPVESTLTSLKGTEMTTGQGEEGSSAWWRGDLGPLLTWIIVVLLVVESWMYHRYVAY